MQLCENDKYGFIISVKSLIFKPTIGRNYCELRVNRKNESKRITLKSATKRVIRLFYFVIWFLNQHLFQILAGIGFWYLCHMLRRAAGNDLSSGPAAFGAQVNDIVRRLD